MVQRRYPPGWQSRDDERRFLRDEDRRSGRDEDDDRSRDAREMRYAYGRYSGTEQADDRRRFEGERIFGARYRRGEGSYGGGMERQGGYRGVGPRGYTRSDERIREDVCDRLTDDETLNAGDIGVTVRDGEVALDGTVASRGDKRHAEDLADSVAGVKNVQNSLRVKEAAGRGDTYGHSTLGETKSQRH